MERIDYPKLKETVFHKTLDNGLKVYLMPKRHFSKTYATFTTNFGSIDVNIDDREIPTGIAHYLEHLLFHSPEGDVSDKFAKYGAHVNAYTSYDKTSYLFTCTSNVEENVELLLDFVQGPHITDELVEKERGIITEELQMYSDNPEVKLILQGMRSLFKTHPMKDDIGGTVDSIKDITTECLIDCHKHFYNPNNMILFVVGNFEEEDMMKLIEDNQRKKDFSGFKNYTRNIPFEEGINVKEITLNEKDVFEKAVIGFKGSPEIYDGDYEKYRLSMMIYLDILFGRSSRNYEELFEKHLINYTFGTLSYIEPLYSVVIIGGDTSHPDELIDELRRMIHLPIDESQFNHMKNKFYGSMLKLLNYPEGIANEYTSFKLAGSDLFNVIDIVNDITLEDILRCKDFFKDEVIVKMKH